MFELMYNINDPIARLRLHYVLCFSHCLCTQHRKTPICFSAWDPFDQVGEAVKSLGG